MITNAKVLKVEGDPSVNSGQVNFVKSISYQDLSPQSGIPSAGKSKEEKKLEVDGVFVEIGYAPSTSFVKNLVDFSETGEIITDLTNYSTKTPGLFAAGDCNKGKYKQIVVASGEGAKAALSAYDYLQRLENQKNA